MEAAHLQIAGMDGMRYLGADPSRPADEEERVVMLAVLRRRNREIERLHGV